MKLPTLLASFLFGTFCHAQIKPLISTYLGDEQRNYYGNIAPSKLNIKWKTNLGSAVTMLGSKKKKWHGAGWTGQPLVISENNEIFLIQPSLSHYLRKIRASDGKIIWSTNLGDAIKGTPSFVTTSNSDPEKKFIIISGSRRGAKNNFFKDPAYSLHAVSYQELPSLNQEYKKNTLYLTPKICKFTNTNYLASLHLQSIKELFTLQLVQVEFMVIKLDFWVVKNGISKRVET